MVHFVLLPLLQYTFPIMLLVSLSLEQFRTYVKRRFTFSPTLTVIVGPNASGKTNILEGLSLCSTGKSFRAETDKECILWGREFSKVKTVTNEDSLEVQITHGFVGEKKTPLKKLLVNGVSRRLVDFAGKMPTVLFSPESLQLVSGSPSFRRRFLDAMISQTDREYRRNLFLYEKGIRQRNKVLERINDGEATRSHLFYWDNLVITSGGYLTDSRQKAISFMNAQSFAGMEFFVAYDKSVISHDRIEQYKDAEVAAKVTLVGPHRDDMLIQFSSKASKEAGKLVSSFGSRGQQRMGVLWLKLCELTFITQAIQNRPVLLLDDIFSELDHEHDTLVMSLIGSYQTIITSADRDWVAKLISGKEGEVIEL